MRYRPRDKPKRPRREWSKVLTVAILLPYLGGIALALAGAAWMIVKHDYAAATALLQAAIVSTAALAAIVYGFYFWKARAENRLKIAQAAKACGLSEDLTKDIITKEEEYTV